MGLTRITAQQISNIDYKQSVRVVTTTNITLAGGAPNIVDGVSLVTNNRILVTGQSTGSQNGLYYVTTVGAGSTGTWTRSTDGDATGEIDAGMIVMVTEGTTYADTQWKLTTDDPITIGTTALTFVQNYSANSISAGTSNVSVGSSANVTISSAGTANVLTISSTGIVVSGTGSVTGNITGGNLLTGGLVSATGSITGASVVGGVITGTSTSVSGTITAATVNAAAIGNVGAAITAATVSAATIGNASAVHNGTTFSASGNITGGNVLFGSGIVSGTGNVTGNIITATTLNATTVSASGNITANSSSFFIGNGSQLTGIAGGGGGGSSITNGTSNITVALNSNITVGVTSASIVTFTTSGIVNNMGNGVGNIGNSTGYFNTVFAKATSAQYADVAEKYIADKDYPVGTVLRIGGMYEVSQTNSYHGTNIIGTVSDKPAYVMNSGLAAEHIAIVALLGRVPCRVIGTISKGDLLVSSEIHGVATVLDPDLWVPGCVIGKALEDYNSDQIGVIEIVVGRS